MRFSGSFVALVTPFHEDGSIHMEKLKELVEWHIEQGTDGIVALGTTGESSTMTHEEDDEVAYSGDLRRGLQLHADAA